MKQRQLRQKPQVPHHPKTDIVVAIVRIPVVAISGPAIIRIVVPGTAANTPETDLPSKGESMVTHKNLYHQIVAWDNLLLAAKNAQRGKKYHGDVARFFFQMEKELFRIQAELAGKTYKPGGYTTFKIYDPKERLISAAPFRDRVVHHALCNIMEPVFEQTFMHDSFANRKGKGTHRAILRYQQFARRYPYVLKCDIKKFFPSVDHAVLKQEIRWKIACPDTLWLIDTIIDNSNMQEPHIAYFPGDDLFTPIQRRRGLPIGNLTSQFWANVYLNRFDHFVKEVLKAPGYVRYVDDFVIFSDSKAALSEIRKQLTEFLGGLRLLTHPDKTQIHQTAKGVPFLGFRVYPDYRIIKKENAHRAARFLQMKVGQVAKGKMTYDSLESGLNSWLGHIRFGQCKRLEYRVFWEIRRRNVNVLEHPRGSWRVL